MSSLPSMAPRKGDITFEEYVDLIEDGQKADLLDGVIYMASPDNTDAFRLNFWLANVLDSYVEHHGLGTVWGFRIAFRLGKKHGPEPDIAFVPKELESTRQRGHFEGAPRLAVEIVSPDSVQRDYIEKRAIYEKAGVQEYWIIDPDETQATFLTLVEGKYEEMEVKKGEFESKAVPGFRITVSWLWAEKRPSPFEVLTKLLRKKGRSPRKRKRKE